MSKRFQLCFRHFFQKYYSNYNYFHRTYFELGISGINIGSIKIQFSGGRIQIFTYLNYNEFTFLILFGLYFPNSVSILLKNIEYFRVKIVLNEYTAYIMNIKRPTEIQ